MRERERVQRKADRCGTNISSFRSGETVDISASGDAWVILWISLVDYVSRGTRSASATLGILVRRALHHECYLNWWKLNADHVSPSFVNFPKNKKNFKPLERRFNLLQKMQLPWSLYFLWILQKSTDLTIKRPFAMIRLWLRLQTLWKRVIKKVEQTLINLFKRIQGEFINVFFKNFFHWYFFVLLGFNHKLEN